MLHGITVVWLCLLWKYFLLQFDFPGLFLSPPLFFSLDTPSQRVQFILGTEDDDEEHIPHDLFTELDELCWREGEDAEWRETAR